MTATNSMFSVVLASELQPERDVFVGLPVENSSKQTFHRIPIRSSCTESSTGNQAVLQKGVGNSLINQLAPDRRMHVKMVSGQSNVVQSIQGLRRLLIKFPTVFVPGIKVFEASGENERTNLSMGFALYDSRTGPTAEESRVIDNLDGLAMFLKKTMVRCDRIRRVLKLGENMTAEQQQVAAEMMDLHVVRPAQERSEGTNYRGTFSSFGSDERTTPARYCYVKLVSPDPNVNEKYHTYFWTMDGRPLRFEQVVAFRNFQVVPFVEVEDIFVSKSLRSLQLKLRECLVIPPMERLQQRYSVCFPDRVCAPHQPEEPMNTAAPTVITERLQEDMEEPLSKRQRMDPAPLAEPVPIADETSLDGTQKTEEHHPPEEASEP